MFASLRDPLGMSDSGYSVQDFGSAFLFDLAQGVGIQTLLFMLLPASVRRAFRRRRNRGVSPLG